MSPQVERTVSRGRYEQDEFRLSELFDRAHLPTVSKIILELHERVIGTAGARRVRSTLSAIGFEELPDLSTGKHLVLQRVSRSGDANF